MATSATAAIAVGQMATVSLAPFCRQGAGLAGLANACSGGLVMAIAALRNSGSGPLQTTDAAVTAFGHGQVL